MRGGRLQILARSCRANQLPPGATALSTVVNVALALLPRVVIAPMQTTMMRASMTAYSTAVGPSSDFKKFNTNGRSLRMCPVLSKETVGKVSIQRGRGFRLVLHTGRVTTGNQTLVQKKE